MSRKLYVLGMVFMMASFSLVLSAECIETYLIPGVIWAVSSLVVMRITAIIIMKNWKGEK